MPAVNMAGTSAAPESGKAVMMNPFTGPTGAVKDNDQSGNFSTGALNTGIGFGLNVVIGPVAPASIVAAGFSDSYVPGTTKPNGVASTDAALVLIGGGSSSAASGGIAATTPLAVKPLNAMGNGTVRNKSVGVGFSVQTVTATASVAVGAAVETGWTNQSGAALASGNSTFGAEAAA